MQCLSVLDLLLSKVEEVRVCPGRLGLTAMLSIDMVLMLIGSIGSTGAAVVAILIVKFSS